MRSVRYSFSLGFFGLELRIWRKEAKGKLRDPMAHLKLSQKLKILRGHALKQSPSYGGARQKEKRYKYYKKRLANTSASYAYAPSSHTKPKRRIVRRTKDYSRRVGSVT